MSSLKTTKGSDREEKGRRGETQGFPLTRYPLSASRSTCSMYWPSPYDFPSTKASPQSVQWIKICLAMQVTQVRSRVWEDSTWCGATKPMATTTEHAFQRSDYRTPHTLEPVLHKRSHGNESPAFGNQRVAPTRHNSRKPTHTKAPVRDNEGPERPKINKRIRTIFIDQSRRVNLESRVKKLTLGTEANHKAHSMQHQLQIFSMTEQSVFCCGDETS